MPGGRNDFGPRWRLVNFMRDHEEGCDCAECRETGWANKWLAAVDMAACASLQRDELHKLASDMIRAKGRHNTMVAYKALEDYLRDA